MHTVMFYVILNKRKRLGDCITFLASRTQATHVGVSAVTMQRLPSTHERLHEHVDSLHEHVVDSLHERIDIHRDSRMSKYICLPCSLYCMQLEAFCVVC